MRTSNPKSAFVFIMNYEGSGRSLFLKFFFPTTFLLKDRTFLVPSGQFVSEPGFFIFMYWRITQVFPQLHSQAAVTDY
jgi:hypothetical protein